MLLVHFGGLQLTSKSELKVTVIKYQIQIQMTYFESRPRGSKISADSVNAE